MPSFTVMGGCAPVVCWFGMLSAIEMPVTALGEILRCIFIRLSLKGLSLTSLSFRETNIPFILFFVSSSQLLDSNTDGAYYRSG